MIIFGYPGIGKSTLAHINKTGKYIDLESSLFKTNSDPYWYKTYGLVGQSLSEQRFDVLMSTHPEVLSFLDTLTIDTKMIIVPNISLRIGWIQMLEGRKDKTNKFKDKMAYLHVRDNFEKDVLSLKKYAERHKKNIIFVELPKWHVDLAKIIEEAKVR